MDNVQIEGPDSKRLALFGLLFIAAVAAVAAIFAVVVAKGGSGTVSAETIREYNLEIVSKDIDYGGGSNLARLDVPKRGRPQ